MLNGSILKVYENTVIPKPLMASNNPLYRFSVFEKKNWFLSFNGNRKITNKIAQTDYLGFVIDTNYKI